MDEDRSLFVLIKHWFVLTVSLASVSTVLLAVNNLESIKVGTSFLPFVFWGWYLIFDAVIVGLVLTVLELTTRWIDTRGHSIRLTGGIVLGGVIVGLTVHASLLYDLVVVDRSLRFMGFTLGVILTGLVGISFSVGKNSRLGLVASLVVAGCLVLSLYPTFEEDVTAELNTVDSMRVESSPGFVLLAVDGADWGFIDPLIEKGELPNLASLKKSGVHAELNTITPTSSPVIWTSVATGRAPDDHGVSDFVSLRITGSDELFSPLNPVVGFSLKPLFWLVIKQPIPVNNRNRSKPAFWNISSMFDHPLTLINWWVTWPAEPIEGMVVTDRIHYRGFGRVKGAPDEPNLTYPEPLYGEIKDLIVRPDQLTIDRARDFMDVTPEEFEELKQANWRHHQLKGEFRFMHSIFETNRRVTNHLVKVGKERFRQSPDLMALFRLIDLTGHTAMKYSTLVDDHLGASREAVRKYDGVLTQAYREIDRVVGEVKKVHPAKNIIIVSDHGFQLETRDNGERWYNHKNAPAGIFLASGPAFRSGQTDGLHVYDVMPMLCYLKGFPIAKDFESSVPRDVFSESFRQQRSVPTISTYGDYEAGAFRRGASATNRRIKNQLKALGYIE